MLKDECPERWREERWRVSSREMRRFINDSELEMTNTLESWGLICAVGKPYITTLGNFGNSPNRRIAEISRSEMSSPVQSRSQFWLKAGSSILGSPRRVDWTEL